MLKKSEDRHFKKFVPDLAFKNRQLFLQDYSNEKLKIRVRLIGT